MAGTRLKWCSEVLTGFDAGHSRLKEVSVGPEGGPMRGDSSRTFVVWLRPLKASIMTKDVPNCMHAGGHRRRHSRRETRGQLTKWFSSVDFPDDCGPMMATTW